MPVYQNNHEQKSRPYSQPGFEICKWSDSDFVVVAVPQNDDRVGLQLDAETGKPDDAMLPSGRLRQ